MRPRFLAIVSSNTLAAFLAKDPVTRPDGFVVEYHCAGGHNAPPRGPAVFDATGQPVYGARDEVDLAQIAALGLPFWLAGSVASPAHFAEARAAGATGIQVGTAFALCAESGLSPELRTQVIAAVRAGKSAVVTDPRASPSGYPFKVATLPGTLSEADVYEARERRCDVGLLRTPYAKHDGSVGYRCPSEPIDAYVKKGGKREETVGRTCLCNALLATAGFPQMRDVGPEPPIVTIGDDVARVVEVLGAKGDWSAADVIAYLLADEKSPASSPS
jgi:NAD(P)H-dependent flavin oxidoreductase YrpB (nitropropane dioxygenase family)